MNRPNYVQFWRTLSKNCKQRYIFFWLRRQWKLQKHLMSRLLSKFFKSFVIVQVTFLQFPNAIWYLQVATYFLLIILLLFFRWKTKARIFNLAQAKLNRLKKPTKSKLDRYEIACELLQVVYFSRTSNHTVETLVEHEPTQVTANSNLLGRGPHHVCTVRFFTHGIISIFW